MDRNRAKTMLHSIGMDYNTHHACPNDRDMNTTMRYNVLIVVHRDIDKMFKVKGYQQKFYDTFPSSLGLKQCSSANPLQE